ncbi:hypothetical protein DPEC_G00251910 [Dallia pectoralis]|uniref:Uncharacterized protein n=1 Tax=Dallia pectoralis TaxID=75939 RepID=A0ACC2FT89_DALPE|nr:hypothetical protein DPEC_G00251910 [Dallia pectoralis]
MGCTIYAASAEAQPGDGATGRDQRCHYYIPHGPRNHRIPTRAARPGIMTEPQEQNEDAAHTSTQEQEPSKPEDLLGGHSLFR